MTKVLVVHHDIDLADQEVESSAGTATSWSSSGPTANTCPTGAPVRWRHAPDVWRGGDADGSMELIADLRRVHPEVPIVLTFPGVGLSGFDDEPTHGVVPLEIGMCQPRLTEPIQRAIKARSGPPSRRGRLRPQFRPTSACIVPAAPVIDAPVVRRPACATLSRTTGVVLLWAGVFLAFWGAWRYGAARAALAPLVRDGDPTRTLVDATRPVHARVRVRPQRATSSSAFAWLGIAMYGMYLATVGMEAWSRARRPIASPRSSSATSRSGGIGVHCQLRTESKMFCGCATAYVGRGPQHPCLPGSARQTGQTWVLGAAPS